MSRSPSRTALLTAATIALPVIVLVLLELFLRAVGFGHGLEPLFIAAPGRADYRQANPDVVKRFFANPADAPRLSIETSYFKAQKPAGSFRIVVQGASSAAGFPYGLGASIAGMVEQRLERSYPEREIEVISTAMAAVTSYALVDFAPEIVAEHPDAVLVYVGHNEYLGILGVGSTLRFASRPWITRLVMAARESRLFQLLRALTPSRAPPGRVLTADDTLMATVAGERSIPFDSGLYRRGLEQYRYNLTRLLSIYARAGIPVYIATVASNERDHPPFAGDDARAEFEVARRHESAQRFLEARHHYQVARDLDELRFRAPSAFNDIVRTVAARSGATVVDTETLLATRSPHGIIGADLMLEHVHPNLEGYFWLADGFYAALIQSPQLGRPDVRIDDATARAEIPVSAIDRWLGSYKMMRIRNGWPFRERSIETVLPEPGSAAERLAQQLYREEINWPQAQDALRRRAEAGGGHAEFALISQILADAFPFVPVLQFDAARGLIRVDRPLDALRYSRRALELASENVDHQLVHAHALALLGRYAEARTTLERALVLDPENATARRVLGQLDAATGGWRLEAGGPNQKTH